jgi:hypothetical protein
MKNDINTPIKIESRKPLNELDFRMAYESERLYWSTSSSNFTPYTAHWRTSKSLESIEEAIKSYFEDKENYNIILMDVPPNKFFQVEDGMITRIFV